LYSYHATDKYGEKLQNVHAPYVFMFRIHGNRVRISPRLFGWNRKLE